MTPKLKGSLSSKAEALLGVHSTPRTQLCEEPCRLSIPFHPRNHEVATVTISISWVKKTKPKKLRVREVKEVVLRLHSWEAHKPQTVRVGRKLADWPLIAYPTSASTAGPQLMFHGHTGLWPETQGPGSPHLRACVQAVFPACTLILCHFLRAASPDHPVPTMLPILSVAHSLLSQPTMHSGAMCPFATPPPCVQCLPPPAEHKPLGDRNGYFVTASDNAWHTVSP